MLASCLVCRLGVPADEAQTGHTADQDADHEGHTQARGDTWVGSTIMLFKCILYHLKD